MIGRFTETGQMDNIRNHLMHGRIVYVFTGESFLLINYNFNEEKVKIKSYDVLSNMEMEKRECNLFDLIGSIKKNIKNGSSKYMLYYGDLGFDDDIYEFLKEYYIPSEELPLIVATALVEPESIRTDISYPCNIKGKALEYADELFSKLVRNYLEEELYLNNPGCHSIYSFWLNKKNHIYEVIFRSNYCEIIDSDEELKKLKKKITYELIDEMIRLGIIQRKYDAKQKI